MIMQKKKSDAAGIVAALDMAPEMAELEQDGADIAAQEVMAALESKDPAALKEALKSFVSMCMDEYDSEAMPEQAE